MITLGTRGSKLALWQANWVADQIRGRFPHEAVILSIISTSGDRFVGQFGTDTAEKGLFVKEIEEALLRREIDLAVHSMKDLPTTLPDGLAIRVVPHREDARDALVACRKTVTIDTLRRGAQIGTGSPRRSAQLKHYRPDLQIVPLRGNVETRLRKLNDEGLDAIILACAGLLRLGLQQHITETLSPEVLLPAVAQGALGLEMRADDEATWGLTRFMHHTVSAACVEAERTFLRSLGGGCQTPIAAHAAPVGTTLSLRGCVISPDGKNRVAGSRTGPFGDPTALGQALAEELLSQGAAALLTES